MRDCCSCCITGARRFWQQRASGGSTLRSGGLAPKASAAPTWGPLEREVAKVWKRILGNQGPIDLRDSFVELGGESLLGLRACAALRYSLLGDVVQDEQEGGPEYGDVSGAFSVISLLAAPSLQEYCAILRANGCKDPPPSEETESSSNDRSVASSVSLAKQVYCCSRQTQESAGTRLAQLLDTIPRQEAMLLCGTAPRNSKLGPRFTALHAAAGAGAESCLQLLLARRAKPTVTEPGALMTPAHYAAMSSASCLRLLLEAKAPLTVRDIRGQSLIHAAARAGNVDSLRVVFDAMERGRSTGRRALRHDEGTRGLLEWTDRWARSAVHWAALNGHAGALLALLEQGAMAAPKLITAHQMSKRTHLIQEQPLDIAVRVHGASSEVACCLRARIAMGGGNGQAPDNVEAVDRQRTSAEPAGDALSMGADGLGPSSGLQRYLLTLGSETGLDRFAVWELRERIKAKMVLRAQCRIFFETDAPPATLMSLKSAEKVCAVVMRTEPSELAKVAANAEPSQVLIAVSQWIASFELWKPTMSRWMHFNECFGSGSAGAPETPTFKVTCRRSGRRFANISSQGLAVALADELTSAYGWRAQVRRPDFEVRVLINDTELLVDVPLLVQGAMRTGGGQLCSAGMSAPVAWALCRSAELRPGDRVLDPMCGKAVILVEAALSWSSCDYIGIDVDEEQLQGAASNAELAAASGARLDLLRGDARRLPFPTDSVDALICDVPFGRQYSTIEECRNGLYGALLAEFDRIVHSSAGRMVLLVSLEQERWLLEAAGFSQDPAAANRHCRWVCLARRELKLGFLEAVILALRRPKSAKAGEGTKDPQRTRDDEKAGAACVETSGLPERAGRLWWETAGGRAEWASLKVGERPPMQFARGREL